MRLGIGGQHTLAYTASGEIVCWGNNMHGQCDPPVPGAPVLHLEGGLDYSLALVGTPSSPTDPFQPDTDGDGLPDGWELEHGMDPLVNNDTDGIEGNGAQDDPDSDGLNNQAESDHDTDPYDADTDGDGVNDGDEVAQGSDPLDPDDHDPRETVTVSLYFGDHSGSHSEKYRLTVAPVSGDPRPAQTRLNRDYGDIDSVSLVLLKGAKYAVSLEHVSTDSNYQGSPRPDYDYTLSVSAPPCVVTNDPSGLFGTHDDDTFFSAAGKHATLYVLKMDLVPDYDRNGKIDDTDRDKAKAGEDFRFWVNDDHDVGDAAEAGGTDIPGQTQTASRDCNDLKANGRRDLLDFFPVLVDVPELNMLVKSGHTLRLRHSNAAVHFMQTRLGDLNAGWHLTHDVGNCGLGMHEPARSAALLQATAEGTQMSPIFVTWLKSVGGKGVILVEGMAASAAPLVLEAVKNGAAVASAELPMRIAPVEQMYTRLSLRGGGSALTAGADVPPDASDYGNFVFVHGYNVNAETARAWGSEVFKRMWQSGMRARYTAVTWDGNEGQRYILLPGGGERTPDYYANVVNAFEAAPRLAAYVNNSLPGTGVKVVAGHSLGNMLVSFAIADHGMSVDKYFMLNAAVAAECYDATLAASDPSDPMVHDDWEAYDADTWAANWHALFAAPDGRAGLTWKGRFAAALPVAYNYYSSRDEVFEILALRTPYPGDGYTISSPNVAYSVGRYSWQKQEAFKGRTASEDVLTAWLTSSDQAGWGFWGEWRMGPPPEGGMDWEKCYTLEQANALTPSEIRAAPVFHHKPPEIMQSSLSAAQRASLLAYAVPALSAAAGSMEIKPNQIPNLNMNALPRPNGWWRTGHGQDEDLDNRWLHSDMKDAAYFYVHPLFVNLVNTGGLK